MKTTTRGLFNSTQFSMTISLYGGGHLRRKRYGLILQYPDLLPVHFLDLLYLIRVVFIHLHLGLSWVVIALLFTQFRSNLDVPCLTLSVFFYRIGLWSLSMENLLNIVTSWTIFFLLDINKSIWFDMIPSGMANFHLLCGNFLKKLFMANELFCWRKCRAYPCFPIEVSLPSSLHPNLAITYLK